MLQRGASSLPAYQPTVCGVHAGKSLAKNPARPVIPGLQAGRQPAACLCQSGKTARRCAPGLRYDHGPCACVPSLRPLRAPGCAI